MELKNLFILARRRAHKEKPVLSAVAVRDLFFGGQMSAGFHLQEASFPKIHCLRMHHRLSRCLQLGRKYSLFCATLPAVERWGEEDNPHHMACYSPANQISCTSTLTFFSFCRFLLLDWDLSRRNIFNPDDRTTISALITAVTGPPLW